MQCDVHRRSRVEDVWIPVPMLPLSSWADLDDGRTEALGSIIYEAGIATSSSALPER